MRDGLFSDIDQKERLMSVDFFRGVVMFLLVAETTGLYDLFMAPKFEGSVFHVIGFQFQHHPWNGLRLWDLGQPFFMFISGVAMWLSYSRRWEEGEVFKDSAFHAIKRSSLLFFFGWAIYRITPVDSNPQGAFLYDILPQLAFASLIAFFLIKRSDAVLLITAFGLLGITEMLYRLCSIPGFDEAFSPGRNFGTYLDLSLTGSFSDGHWVVFNMIPSTALVIWGVLSGRIIKNGSPLLQKSWFLIYIGLGGVVVGLGLGMITPIIRRICTSSFIIFSGGLCFLAMAISFWIIDVRRFRRWAIFFVAVGMNSIFIYLFTQSGGADCLRLIVEPFLVGGFGWLGGYPAQLATSLATLGFLWLLCYGLYKRKIFIRI